VTGQCKMAKTESVLLALENMFLEVGARELRRKTSQSVERDQQRNQSTAPGMGNERGGTTGRKKNVPLVKKKMCTERRPGGLSGGVHRKTVVGKGTKLY